MKKVLLICLLSASVIVNAQTTETKYYRSRPFDEEVPQSKAKYSETITKEDGVITTTTRNLKKDEIERREAWKGDEPVGKWIGLTGTGPEERDYDFVLRYEERTCENPDAISALPDFFASNNVVGYTAPVIDYKDPQFMSFIRHKLRYPSKAVRHGIQGAVHLAFTITREGIIKDIVVTRGVDIVLDKEAVRVIRLLKLSSPAMLNGKPQEICVKMPIQFKLS